MQYCTSSQAKSWVFSSESLAECKRRALSCDMRSDRGTLKTSVNHVRKFASGFHTRREFETNAELSLPLTISVNDQDTMIQFHAHQIQFLIGPNAILYDLRRSEKVLSTAIIYFRRFYLSNSIIEISPRKIAAACAFFSAKVEEERVEVCWGSIP
jgi:cyclin H